MRGLEPRTLRLEVARAIQLRHTDTLLLLSISLYTFYLSIYLFIYLSIYLFIYLFKR